MTAILFTAAAFYAFYVILINLICHHAGDPSSTLKVKVRHPLPEAPISTIVTTTTVKAAYTHTHTTTTTSLIPECTALPDWLDAHIVVLESPALNINAWRDTVVQHRHGLPQSKRRTSFSKNDREEDEGGMIDGSQSDDDPSARLWQGKLVPELHHAVCRQLPAALLAVVNSSSSNNNNNNAPAPNSRWPWMASHQHLLQSIQKIATPLESSHHDSENGHDDNIAAETGCAALAEKADWNLGQMQDVVNDLFRRFLASIDHIAAAESLAHGNSWEDEEPERPNYQSQSFWDDDDDDDEDDNGEDGVRSAAPLPRRGIQTGSIGGNNATRQQQAKAKKPNEQSKEEEEKEQNVQSQRATEEALLLMHSQFLAPSPPRDDLILAVHLMRSSLALAIAGFYNLIEPTSASFLLGYHHHHSYRRQHPTQSNSNTDTNAPQWWLSWGGTKKEYTRAAHEEVSDLSHALTRAAHYVAWGESYLAQLDHLEALLIGLADQATRLRDGLEDRLVRGIAERSISSSSGDGSGGGDGGNTTKTWFVGVGYHAAGKKEGEGAEDKGQRQGQQQDSRTAVLVPVLYEIETTWVVGSGDTAERLQTSMENLMARQKKTSAYRGWSDTWEGRRGVRLDREKAAWMWQDGTGTGTTGGD